MSQDLLDSAGVDDAANGGGQGGVSDKVVGGLLEVGVARDLAGKSGGVEGKAGGHGEGGEEGGALVNLATDHLEAEPVGFLVELDLDGGAVDRGDHGGKVLVRYGMVDGEGAQEGLGDEVEQGPRRGRPCCRSWPGGW